jgi:hypothetical protein
MHSHAFKIVFLFIALIRFTGAESNERPWLVGTPTALPLLKKRNISPDTKLYTFGLRSQNKENRDDTIGKSIGKDLTLGISTCSCILVTSIPSTSEEKGVTRPYTPVSHRNKHGSFDLLVKSYPRGSMSKQFDKMKIGDCMKFHQVR